MLSVEEATRRVLATVRVLPTEWLALERAAGRVLRENLHADRDFPPFDRVTMDGIAVRHAAVAAGQTEFCIAYTQLAGQPPQPVLDAQAAVEIMTGAMLPPELDAVVRYEDLSWRTDDAGRRWATLHAAPPRPGHNVHARATDRRQGDLLLPAGCRLSAAELAVAATVGAATVAVARPPRVAVVGTGDELVPVADTPLPYQIRRSNALMLRAAAETAGAVAETFHFNDDPAALRPGLRPLLNDFDAVVLSGAVSKGKADFLPDVLQVLGVEQVFHEVRQRPGKPFWFGRQPSGAVVFALPGNPVSSFINFYRYVRPWLLAAQQPKGQVPAEAQPIPVVLAADVSFAPALTHFLQVRLHASSDGCLLAHPAPAQGSGDLASLLDGNAFVELPADTSHFSAGTVLPAWLYSTLH